MLGLDAHGIVLILRVDLIFLCYGVLYLVFGVGHVAVVVHQLVHHILRYDGVDGQILYYGVVDAMYALSAYAYVYLCYVSL